MATPTFSLNRELSLLPGDFIHLTQDDGNNWTPFEIKAILLLARQEIRLSTSLRNYKWYNTTRCGFRQKMEKLPRLDFSSQR